VCWHVLLCPRFDAATGDVRYFVDPATQLRLPYCPQVRLAHDGPQGMQQHSRAAKLERMGVLGKPLGHAGSSRCEKEHRADPGLVILKWVQWLCCQHSNCQRLVTQALCMVEPHTMQPAFNQPFHQSLSRQHHSA